jgi:hypothetical protein
VSNNTVTVGNGLVTSTFTAKDVGMFLGVGVAAVVVGVLAYWGQMKIQRQ